MQQSMEHVANVEIPDNMDTTDALEMAFQLTNHINSAWWENDAVTRVDNKEYRSTSTGDIVKLNGKSWRVLSIGWSEMEGKKDAS